MAPCVAWRRGPGDDDPPLGTDTDIPVHSHPYHEMFYVLEGEVEIGGTIYTAGSCIYIEKNTPYGPTRAPKGGKVLRYAEAGIGK
jgi:mannose-6-phosphate isomerase-like protein (cupin superfamily)